MVDKNLFLYDLAIVSIMKNNALYIKEWLDYHLLAGVDHFFIYDNGSTDNIDEVIKPYVEKEIVTKINTSTWQMGIPHYNEALKKFRFQCRYIAFIDQDEFIFPKSKPTITEVADEILSSNPNAVALGANWRFFGSNGQEKADYTRGVLDRFTACDDGVDRHIKSILNPRKVNFFLNPHFGIYFDGCYSLTEEGKIFSGPFNYDKTDNKIAVHHYYTKSKEEFEQKIAMSLQIGYKRDMEAFRANDRNKIFNDEIIKYRDARRAVLIPDGDIAKLFPAKQINYQRLFNALTQNLMPTVTKGVPQNFFEGKVENFLTCLNLIPKIKDKVFDDIGARFFEEAALNAIFRALHSPLQLSDVMLLIDEMPKILSLNYTAVKNIRDVLLNLIPQVMTTLRLNGRWQEFMELQYKLELLKTFPKS